MAKIHHREKLANLFAYHDHLLLRRATGWAVSVKESGQKGGGELYKTIDIENGS